MSATQSSAWKALQAHYESNGKTLSMEHLFAQNPRRFSDYSTEFIGADSSILLDYSKNLVESDTMKLLFDLVRESKVEEWRDRMFKGEPINSTEQRAVLHIALRNRSNTPIYVAGKDVCPDVNAVLEKMKGITNDIHGGVWKGYTGKNITDIVNIGIGGSDLGPVMVL